ncbi:helix-turn-helix domain-containing protein [Burkholderia glumae]|uniref:helix-turn-helix domain-containing protein n=1 Tax=Burkholderia glumae TaxID=337 RepID=UPI00214FE4D7|nr:helix-turn-helix transcriptional regulator [Burkholderia glumae]
MSDKLSDEQLLKIWKCANGTHPDLGIFTRMVIDYGRAVLAAASPAPAIPAEPLPIDGWYVEVAANGERVLTISDDAVCGLDELDPFAPIIRGAAAQLISFIGPGRDHVGNHVALSQSDPVMDALPDDEAAPAISESEDAAPSFKSQLTPFGQLVRSLRVVTGTLLGDMARAMGVSSAELSAIEFGRRPITPEKVKAISDFFENYGLPRTAPLLQGALDAARKGEKS